MIMNHEDALKEWEKMAKALTLPLEKFEISNYRNFDPKEFL